MIPEEKNMQTIRRILIYFLTLLTTALSFSFSARQPAVDFPKAAVEAKTLLLTNVPGDGAALTLASMQGLLADRSETNLLFRDGRYVKWLPYTDAETVAAQPDGAPWDLPALLEKFAPYFDGYILCDPDSAGIALSIAKQKNSIAVLPEYEAAAQAAGLSLTKDVRGMSDLQFRLTPEFRALRRDVAFEQPTAFAPRLVDYAVMCGAYMWYDKDALQAEHTNAFRFLNDGALVFGYNNDLGEHATVSSFSRLNACLVPADHAHNLSVLSGFPSAAVRQKTDAAAEPGGRTVCLLMSDGDNLQWFLNSYDDASHFGSSVRGDFPFAWGIPASAADLAAPMLERYYDEMSANDAFVLSLSGLGYTFPSRWTNRLALNHMADTLRRKMEATDTHALLVLDDGGFNSTVQNTLLRRTGADGIFYIDFHGYADLQGKTRFVDGRPVVSARYRLWNGTPGCSPEEIAAAINAQPADPKNPDSYAFVIVHAWSGLDGDGNFVEGGDTMAAVQRLVGLLDENTRLVSPAQFMDRLAENCGKK